MQVRLIRHVTRPQLTKTKLPRGFKTAVIILEEVSWLKSCLKFSITLLNNVMLIFTFYSFYNLIIINHTRLEKSDILSLSSSERKSNLFFCWSDWIPLAAPSRNSLRAATSLQRGQASLATLEGGSCTVPEAVVTVLCTPDDGCGWHSKHVQWTCRIINWLLCVASRWTIINIDQRHTEP